MKNIYSFDECICKMFVYRDYLEKNYEDIVKLCPKLKVFIDKWFDNPFEDTEEEGYDRMDYDMDNAQNLVKYMMWQDWVEN